MKEVRLSATQLFFLIVGFIIGSSAIINSAQDGRDSWIVYLIGWAGGGGLIFIYATIAHLNPGKTLVEILKAAFGRVIGTILSLLYIWYFIHLAALVTRNFGFFLVTTTYERTPEIFMVSWLLLLAIYTLKKGLHVLGRSSELFTPMLIVSILIICLALSGRYDPSVLLPLLENGLLHSIKHSFAVMAFPFGEMIVFMMLFSALDNKKSLRKTSLLAVGAGGFFLFLALMRDLLVLGPEMISRLYFPPAVSSELIPVLNLDPLIGINLLIAGGIKICVCFYAAIKAIAQIFNLDSYKPLVIPVGILIVSVAMWLYEDIFQMLYWAKEIYLYYAIPFQFIIPVVVLGISLYKRHKKMNKKVWN